MSGANIAFILSGSIACPKACDVVSRLVKEGHRVRIVATAAALRFVGVAALEGLSGSPVMTDLFAPGAALEHINLTRWADAVVVCPATAGLLNRLSAGLADDLAGALYLAHDRSKPWIVVPAMNPMMWSHPATRASVEKLRDWGVRVLGVATGPTACGEAGEGRMLETDAIYREIVRTLARPEKRLRVLVTSGGTAEPLDSVRVLTNTSSGRTGALIAGHFDKGGHEVTLLRAASSVEAGASIRQVIFGSYADLEASLSRLLSRERFDAIIHSAAVGDYGVESVTTAGRAISPNHKIPSGEELTVLLRPRAKLIDQLRDLSINPRLLVVGFKLTSGSDDAESNGQVRSLFERRVADLVVHNDLAWRTGDTDPFPAEIHRLDGTIIRCPTRSVLACELERMLLAILSDSPAAETLAQTTHAAMS
jgi:phosphopantothenoylcysteine decarboxylase/phosphopantothenate--cysteine ligase